MSTRNLQYLLLIGMCLGMFFYVIVRMTSLVTYLGLRIFFREDVKLIELILLEIHCDSAGNTRFI